MNHSALITLGSNIASYRTKAHLTLQELSNATDIEITRLIQAECGELDIDITELFEIADALNIKGHQLFDNIGL